MPHLLPSPSTLRGAAAVALTSAALVAVAACGDASGGLGIGPPSGGGFGQTEVFPECGALNQACLTNGLNSPLASGGKLGIGVDYKIGGSSGPPTGLASTNEEVLTVEDGVVTAEGPGLAGILMQGPDERVVDFIHVWVAEPQVLRVIRYNEVGLAIGAVREDATLLAGDELFVAVEALADNQPLIGLFKATWTIEVLEADPDGSGEPVLVVEDIVFGWYRVVAREPGRVRITVDALGLEKVIELEVLP